jgi:hypothetical protein
VEVFWKSKHKFRVDFTADIQPSTLIGFKMRVTDFYEIQNIHVALPTKMDFSPIQKPS